VPYVLLPLAWGVAEAEFDLQLQGVVGFLEAFEMRQHDNEKLARYLNQVRQITLLPYPRDQAMDEVLAAGGVRHRYEYDGVDRLIGGFLVLRHGEIVYGGPSTPRVEAHLKEPTAVEILNKVQQTYAECISYTDTGVVSCPDRNSESFEIQFTTAFMRPSAFRFEFSRNDEAGKLKQVVWSDGEEVRTWSSDASGVVKEAYEESLGSTIAVAAGASAGSIHRVPRLLGVVEQGASLTSIRNAQRIEDAILDSNECFRVRGRLGWVSTTLWIDVDTYLLRRVEQHHSLIQSQLEDPDTLEFTITTTYDASIDEIIEDRIFRFSPATEEELEREK
jgi:hypothetical protein